MAFQRLLNVARRNGTVTSPVFNVPESVTGRFILNTDINAADFIDPTKSLECRIYVSSDNGATWQRSCGFGWRGGPYVSRSGLPSPCIVVDAADYAGKQVRVEIDMPSSLRVGIQIQAE